MTDRWTAPQKPALAAGEVHVWRAELDEPDSEASRLIAVASPDEHLRASRYRSPLDARRFLLARCTLRHLLSRYVAISAAELLFRFSTHGKPSLANAGAEWLQFNVSHSGGLALYAVARDQQVGIDVEQIRDDVDALSLANTFFAEAEASELKRLSPVSRTAALFACWTRKEAFLKACGSGLSAALDSFEIPVPRDHAGEQLLPVMGGDGEWSVRSLDPGNGFAAACAAHGQNWRIRLWQWSPGWLIRSQAA